MQSTTEAPVKQPRKARPKPERSATLIEAPALDGRPGTLRLTIGKDTTSYELAPIPEAAWGRAFSLRKQDGTEYAVNLGDEAKGMPPSCECPGHQRWGYRTECKHLSSLRALVNAGKL
jgi:hypothetical protein